MDLNEKKERELNLNKSNHKSYLIELNNNICQNNITYSSNKDQSNASIKTTEYSSESGDFISKYIIDNIKKHKKNKLNKDSFKENINNNIPFNNTFNNNKLKEKSKNQKDLNTKKGNKAPKCVEYKSEYLSKVNSNINAPKIPINYDYSFDLDNLSNQNRIGEKEYIKNFNNNKYNKNEEFKVINGIPNDKLSHLFINKNIYVNKNNRNYNKLSLTQRIKHKCLTIIYVSPK